MLKRNHLRQFLAIVETGGITAAARRLNLSQPTLSAGLAELERLVGAPLLMRDRKQIRLTAAGTRLLAHARTIEREFRLAEMPADGLAPMAAPLRLGVLSSLPAQVLVTLARDVQAVRPLVLVEGSDADLRRRLGEGQLDAILTLLHGPGPQGGAGEGTVVEEGYAMLLPRDHPLAGRGMLSALDLAAEVMVARRSCEILAETSRFFTAQGVRPHFLLRSANEERCLALVRAGLAVTTGPVCLADNAANGGIVAVPLAGYDFRRRLGLIGGGQALDLALVASWARLAQGWNATGSGARE
ncbi:MULTISPECIES: LysR family transcriptional regulator [unclassified Novosphingobium]|uniref:LysR family transcriptional regulator n=1 Tax=unclassified Novosphingobium TaxID=2644732 RepID=UPI00146E7BD0|nr:MULTISPECIES: LysR family transcriptional regulator [unclassified Novosphingobium]NMN05253.1 DNA-binding transcriptional LysR family regulator [Novosphingobium sp. SG919]NMN87548.1 DNA-binding transcriptional LysR family regulator [Novosphingobium sp. SG916]